MDTKTRKILSRIGAGLMLGLSLFNLGAAWQKGGGTEMPKRARQIRKRETEDLKKETQQLAEVAEQEGRAVIALQQTQQEQPLKVAGQQLTTYQLAIRFIAVAVWGATASLFFASMLFNIPFALGKAVLSLLPGIPHTSILSLQADRLAYQEGEEIRIQLSLDSDNDPVNLVKAVIIYDPEKTKFDHFKINPLVIDQVKKSENESGRLTLTLEKDQAAALKNEETLATLYFVSVSESQARLEIDKKASLVVMPREDKKYNILGDTAAVRLRITKPGSPKLACQEMEIGSANQLATWQELVVDNILPEEKSAWLSLDQQRAILCRYDSERVYLLYNGPTNDKPILHLSQAGEKKNVDKSENLNTWTANNREYYVFSIKRTLVDQTKFDLELENEEIFHWPAKGQATFSLD